MDSPLSATTADRLETLLALAQDLTPASRLSTILNLKDNRLDIVPRVVAAIRGEIEDPHLRSSIAEVYQRLWRISERAHAAAAALWAVGDNGEVWGALREAAAGADSAAFALRTIYEGEEED